MTTIAANLEYMAADTKVTMGSNDIYHTRKKIQRIKVKGKTMIAGAAGLDFYIQQFFLFLKQGGEPKMQRRDIDEHTEDLNFEGLVLCSEGILLYDDTLTAAKIEEPFYAIGSGGQAARAAMTMGADPKQAIKIASKIDSATGLPIVTLKLSKDKTNAR